MYIMSENISVVNFLVSKNNGFYLCADKLSEDFEKGNF